MSGLIIMGPRERHEQARDTDHSPCLLNADSILVWPIIKSLLDVAKSPAAANAMFT